MIDRSASRSDWDPTRVLRLIEESSFDEAEAELSRLSLDVRPEAVMALIGASRALCRAGAAHQLAAQELQAAADQQKAIGHQLQLRLVGLIGSGANGGRRDVQQPTRHRRRLWRRARSEGDRPPGPTADEPIALRKPTAGESAEAPDADAGAVEQRPPLEHPVAASTGYLPPVADVVAHVLGNLEVVVAGRPVEEWGSLKGRSVLQYLLLAGGEPVRRETLMDLLWRDHSHRSARNNLNVALYALRRAAFPDDLGRGPFIEYHQGAYMLGRRVSWWIDRDAFLEQWNRASSAQASGDGTTALAAYEQAGALYRGRLFEDDPTGEWFLNEQRLIEERYLVTLERIAALRLVLDDVEVAAEALQRVIARDACRESAHRSLMQCYGRLHQHQLVTRQFNRCVDSLNRELGIQPTPETVRVFRDLIGDAT